MQARVYIGGHVGEEEIYWDCPFCNNHRLFRDEICSKCGATLEIEAHQN